MYLKNDKAIWLIGASRGIGKALLAQLAAEARVIFISARDEQTLTALANQFAGQINVVPLDVTQPTQIDHAISLITQQVDCLDKVIINAGTCEYIDSDAPDTAIFKRMMEINFHAPLLIFSKVMPLLKAQNEVLSHQSECVFISSSVHYFALPRAAAYGASKAALSYMVESLAADLQHKNIRLTLVHPGFVKTDLTDNNDFPMPFLLSAEQAAKRIIKGLEKGQRNISFPKRLIWPLQLLGALPMRWRLAISGKLSRMKQSKG